MLRTFLILAVLWSATPALAADIQPSAPVQQSVLQLRSDLAGVRAALGVSRDPRATLTAALPGLKDRARAASLQAAAYEARVTKMREVASLEKLRAQAEYAVAQVEGMTPPIMGDTAKFVSLTNAKLDELSLAVEQLLAEVGRLATEDQQALNGMRATCTQACLLSHANAGCQSGKCVIASCHPGWVDNDGNVANGCEAPVRN